MKRAILLLCAFFTTLSLQAELHVTTYGDEGWKIGLHENVVVDIDNDGANDFYVNQFTNELGFTPIFGKGCFSSYGSSYFNNIGTRELRIHQPGEILDGSANTMGFIDTDRGSAYSYTAAAFADGWVDGEETYVGFYIFGSGLFGWIKVEIDVAGQQLIIKEMAYNDVSHEPIEIGYTGIPQEPVIPEPNVKKNGTDRAGDYTDIIETATNDISKDLQELTIAPNPTSDNVYISLNYVGEKDLNIVITNGVGKEMYRTLNNITSGEMNLEVSTSSWSSGIYFIQFRSELGIKTERLSVAK